jgi:hypothetical protein
MFLPQNDTIVADQKSTGGIRMNQNRNASEFRVFNKKITLPIYLAVVVIGVIGYTALGIIGEQIGPGWDDILQGGGGLLLLLILGLIGLIAIIRGKRTSPYKR